MPQLDVVTEYTPKEAADVQSFLAEWRREKAKPPPEPEPTPEPETPKVETSDLEVFAPWDFRFFGFLLKHFGLGSQDGMRDMMGRTLWLHRKLLVWFILAWPRLRRMLWVVFSGKADAGVAHERRAACDKCPQLKIGKNGEAYCGACGCPDWHFSRLAIKNRLKANHCPQKLHTGEYVKLVTHKWPNLKKTEAQAPVKRGCGGGRNG